MAENGNGTERRSDSSGTGLTLKQLVLEVREDVRALRGLIEGKVDISEFNQLKTRVDDMLAGRSTSAYGDAMLKEYRDLQTKVKELSDAKVTANAAADAVAKYEAKLSANRKWIMGLVAGFITQGLILAAKLVELAQKGQ